MNFNHVIILLQVQCILKVGTEIWSQSCDTKQGAQESRINTVECNIKKIGQFTSAILTKTQIITIACTAASYMKSATLATEKSSCLEAGKI